MFQFIKRKVKQFFCRHIESLRHWDIDPKNLPGWRGMKCGKCGKEWSCFRDSVVPK